MSRAALGRGLSALIREPDRSTEPTRPAAAPSAEIQEVPIELIDPNPYQPRTGFHEEALEELARSIRATGIIQPLLLRPHGLRYQLIAGERRWRAAQRAGLDRVPAVVREVPEAAALEMTLVENLQREDLNPIEQGKAFERLITEFRLTQEEVAQRTGKDRATVANAIRLLRLDQPIRDLLEGGKLSAGHGRALLGIADERLRLALANRAARRGLTVRQIERMATRAAGRVSEPQIVFVDPNIRSALEELQRALGTKVLLRPIRGRRPGQLVIEYYDNRQLMDLYERLAKT